MATAEITPIKVENSLVWSFGLKQIPRGTQKVRWVFAHATQPIALAGISACTRSRCETLDVRIEATNPMLGTKDLADVEVTQLAWAPKAEIDVYNGVLVDPKEKSSHHCTWIKSEPLTLKVRYAVPQRYKADRTVLRFQMTGVAAGVPGTAFGVAIEDLLANDCVYVPHARLFVTRLPAPITLADYLKKIVGQKTVLEQVRQKPDQDFTRAWSVVHNPVQDLGPMMLSLANDNRKFIALREGGILFDEYDRPDDPHVAYPGSIYEIAFNLPWRCSSSLGVGKDIETYRSLNAGWLPMHNTSVSQGGGLVVYRQKSYVAPMSDAVAGTPFWFRDRAVCVAEYGVINRENKANPARIALNFSNEKKKPFQLQEVKEGVLVVQGDRVIALIDTRKADPLAVKREAESVVLSGEMPGRSMGQCFAYFPAWKVDPKDYALLLKGNPRNYDSLVKGEDAAGRVVSYWTKLLEPAMQIEVPDALLTDIIRASQVHCMLAARNLDRGARIAAWAMPPATARSKASRTRRSAAWT